MGGGVCGEPKVAFWCDIRGGEGAGIKGSAMIRGQGSGSAAWRWRGRGTEGRAVEMCLEDYPARACSRPVGLRWVWIHIISSFVRHLSS